jgi:riboflavin kinase/FMN adenylyltransferase
MNVYNHTSDLLKKFPDSRFGLTIGNFDGVHRGHQKLLLDIKNECEKQGREFFVLTFVPHPLTILRNQSDFLINTYEERRELLENLGIKNLVEIKFDRDFSTNSPAAFLEEYILFSRVEVLHLGHDFAFGANKAGDHNFVEDYCKNKSIKIAINQEFQSQENENISSSTIRTNLQNGKIEAANDLLDREFFIEGTVVKGKGRGRQLGFPTANFSYNNRRIVPAKGVYATKLLYKGGMYNSITNIGNNPTFTDVEGLQVETHVLDFDNDIYGENFRLFFISRLRDEKKFSSVNELIQQIKTDCEKRRSIK